MSLPCFSGHLPFEPEGEFEALLAAGEAGVYNPWPQLVDLDSPGLAWSSPFLRALYLPSTRPRGIIRALYADQLSVEWRVALTHEFAGHLAFETPAREWGRACLSLCYDQLGEMAKKDLASWGSFKAFNNLFRQVCEAIRLPEELIATAFSFAALGKEGQKENTAFEQACVEHYDATLPGFAALYYGGIKRAVSLLLPYSVFKDEWPLAVLASFLEPLELTSGLPIVGDCEGRCRLLVDAMGKLATAEEVEAWLHMSSRDLGDEVSVQTALTLQAELHKNRDTFHLGPLSQMVRAGRLGVRADLSEHWARQAKASYWSSPVTSRPRLAILAPFRFGESWFISPWLANYTKPMRGALVLEALRQQLDEGVGFDCPVAVADAEPLVRLDKPMCVCGESFKEVMQTFVNWALAGKLGLGASDTSLGRWHALMSPCDT